MRHSNYTSQHKGWGGKRKSEIDSPKGPGERTEKDFTSEMKGMFREVGRKPGESRRPHLEFKKQTERLS